MHKIKYFRSAGNTIIVFFSAIAITGLFAISPVPLSAAASPVYNIEDYGAIGDGLTLNTAAIQAAIDVCAENGGGTVYFPAGTFLSGTIYFKDHITLQLASGAVLLGSTSVEDYPLNQCRYPSGSDRYVARALIWGEDLHDLTITGRGTIDGQGADFGSTRISGTEWRKLVSVYKDTTRFRTGPSYINRPYLIRLISCRNILIEKVTLQKPAMWMQHYLNCDYVTIRDVNIYSHGNQNNDLIDIGGSRNVVISGCYGDSDDDGITLKSTTADPVQNVTISDCIIRSRTNTIKAGTESSAGFRDITITNCILKPSLADTGFSGRSEGLAGIALEIVDGGSLDRVTISNITIEDMAAPIFLRLGNRGRPNRTFQKNIPVGTFKNVRISNIIASKAGSNGCSILGIKGHDIENVSISNVYINFDGGGTRETAESDYPENETDYPESTRYGDLPAYGFFCRHVDGLTFRDIVLDFNEQEARAPLIFDDVKNLRLLNISGQVSASAPAQMIMKNCRNVSVSECQPKDIDVFLRLEKNSGDINITGNDLSRVKRPILLDQSMNMSAIDFAYNLPADRSLFSLLEPIVERDAYGTITMHPFTPDSEIRYTLNGRAVTEKSKKYTKPFMQIGACQVKANVIKDKVMSASAELNLPTLQVIKPEIRPDHSFFYDSVKIELRCATSGAEIQYSMDKNVSAGDGLLYDQALELKKSGLLYVQALKDGYRTSEVAVSINEKVARENGVLYKYYSGTWEKLPDLPAMKAQKSGHISRFELEEIPTAEANFALLLIGAVRVKKAGNYIFYCGSNDGSQLFVDNRLLIDNDGYHGYIEKSGKLFLQTGMHLIEVRYFQMGGGRDLKVSWEGEDFDKHIFTTEDLAVF